MGNRQYEGRRFRVLKFFNEWNLMPVENHCQQIVNISTDKGVVNDWSIKTNTTRRVTVWACCLSYRQKPPSRAMNNQFQSKSSKRNQDNSTVFDWPFGWGRNKKILQSMEATWSMCRLKAVFTLLAFGENSDSQACSICIQVLSTERGMSSVIWLFWSFTAASCQRKIAGKKRASQSNCIWDDFSPLSLANSRALEQCGTGKLPELEKTGWSANFS